MATFAAMADDAGTPAPQGTTTATIRRLEKTPSAPAWQRQVRQLGLFFAGAGFMAASVAVSRRAVLRRRLDALPKFYSSNRDGVKFDSSDRSVMAVQALGLATLNVMSFGVLLVGGISWAFDLCSVEDLRARSKAAMQRRGAVNPEEEKQLEEMMNNLLSKLGMEKPTLPEKEENSKKD